MYLVQVTETFCNIGAAEIKIKTLQMSYILGKLIIIRYIIKFI